VADLTGDGLPDVVTVNFDSNDISVLVGRGDGTLAAQQRFDVGADPLALVVADLTGDGLPDVVTANTRSADISVLVGRGDGTFE
jgi:FG-GAP-like repeat